MAETSETVTRKAAKNPRSREPTPDETVGLYLKDFRSLKKGEFSGEPAVISQLRQAGMNRFTELGFPTPALENWKHTDIHTMAREAYRRLPDEPAELDGARLNPYVMGDFYRVVVVNGRFDRTLSSLPSRQGGIEIGSLAEAIHGDAERLSLHLGQIADYHNQALVALNTAFMADGVFIHVPENTVLDRPVHVMAVSDPPGPRRAYHLRHLIWAEPGSEITVVEHYVGLSEYDTLINQVTEIVVSENAKLCYVKLQEGSEEAYRIATTDTFQLENSTVSAWSVVMGGKLTRNDANTRLDGEGCECILNGLVLARGRQHVDNHTFVSHEKPHGTSHQLYKGIHGDRSHGVFNGRIRVQQDAQKTNADQENRNLLLTNEALVNSNPQLEINADDVRCTHGSTTGQLDKEATFYLQSRGLDAVSAKTLLATGFAAEVIQDIPPEPVRDYLSRRLEDWLSGIRWEALVK
ncbi:MAG: Fe-S cluster assembly protein SufD [Fidelibacterota bacterium]